MTRTLKDYRPQHDPTCQVGAPKLECPTCGGLLDLVRQKPNSMLNEYQFDAVKAGDYYCTACKGGEAQGSTYKYWWARELALHSCSCGLDALLVSVEGEQQRIEEKEDGAGLIHQVASPLAETLPRPICGDCRYVRRDEHCGGRNDCAVRPENDPWERYRFGWDKPCSVFDDRHFPEFKPSAEVLDKIVDGLRAQVGNAPDGTHPSAAPTASDRAETEPRLTIVKLRDDESSPVAAPCAIAGTCQYGVSVTDGASDSFLSMVWRSMSDAERYAEYVRVRVQRDARWPEALTREQRSALGAVARAAKADWMEVSTASDPHDAYEAIAVAVAITLPSVLGSATPSLSEASASPHRSESVKDEPIKLDPDPFRGHDAEPRLSIEEARERIMDAANKLTQIWDVSKANGWQQLSPAIDALITAVRDDQREFDMAAYVAPLEFQLSRVGSATVHQQEQADATHNGDPK